MLTSGEVLGLAEADYERVKGEDNVLDCRVHCENPAWPEQKGVQDLWSPKRVCCENFRLRSRKKETQGDTPGERVVTINVLSTH